MQGGLGLGLGGGKSHKESAVDWSRGWRAEWTGWGQISWSLKNQSEEFRFNSKNHGKSSEGLRKATAWSDLVFCFVFVLLLGAGPVDMEVPRRGVQSELQLPAYTTATAMPNPNGTCRIWATFATYTVACGNAGSLTHWERPGIEPASLRILVRFSTHWTTIGTLYFF